MIPIGTKASLYTPFHVTFNGVQDSTVGVTITKRPDIPPATERVERIRIPGRDGELTVKDGTVDDITINVDFAFSVYPDDWQVRVRAVKDWLQMPVPYVDPFHDPDTYQIEALELRFSDLPGAFYKVRCVEVSDFTRQHKKDCRFTASFICEGWQYLDSGLSILGRGYYTNPSRYTSHPIYEITATTDGTATLTVGSKSLQATIAQNLTIDTDRMVCYRSDGTLVNTDVLMGDYTFSDFWLPSGMTYVNLTSGFTLKGVPMWRRL